MTERWRKKLEGIDQVAPRDDVYERAKAGSTLPESRSPMRRTSTRVATAIAAFVVFALAISLFAIPTLRLGGQQLASAGTGIQPLWPWNSTDAVRAWRDDPQPIGTTSVDHFSSASDVAAAFGRDVLGWGVAWPTEDGQPTPYQCTGAMAYPMTPTLPSDEATCSVFPDPRSLAPTAAGYVPTTAPSGFRTFDLSTCPPNARCPVPSPAPPSVKVIVYEPLGVNGPWAVLEARSDYMGMALDPGTTLRDGSMVYARGVIVPRAQAVLGFIVASPGCEGTGAVTGFEGVGEATTTDVAGHVTTGTYASGQIQIGLHPLDGACARQPGYVYLALTEGDIGTGDPLGGFPPGTNVLAFAAVPASFLFPTAQESSSLPSTPAPAEPGWTTYTDALGWTVDVPASWTSGLIHSNATCCLAVGSDSGEWFTSGEPLPIPSGAPARDGPDPAPGQVIIKIFHSTKSPTVEDDSSLPLDAEELLHRQGSEWDGFFHADGIEFVVATYTGDGGALSPQQHDVIQRMISSIRFQPWSPGEIRGDFAALNPTANRPASWKQDGLDWQQIGGRTFVYMENGQNGVLLGPMPDCGSGEVHDVAMNVRAALLECPDGTKGGWTIDG